MKENTEIGYTFSTKILELIESEGIGGSGGGTFVSVTGKVPPSPGSKVTQSVYSR